MKSGLEFFLTFSCVLKSTKVSLSSGGISKAGSSIGEERRNLIVTRETPNIEFESTSTINALHISSMDAGTSHGIDWAIQRYLRYRQEQADLQRTSGRGPPMTT
jgi:hypothetical protein